MREELIALKGKLALLRGRERARWESFTADMVSAGSDMDLIAAAIEHHAPPTRTIREKRARAMERRRFVDMMSVEYPDRHTIGTVNDTPDGIRIMVFIELGEMTIEEDTQG